MVKLKSIEIHNADSFWVYHLVSLFTDTASEMLVSDPADYLKVNGFSICALLGILEGSRRSKTGLKVKGTFGKLFRLLRATSPICSNWANALAHFKQKPMIGNFYLSTLDFLWIGQLTVWKRIRQELEMPYFQMRQTPKPKGKVFGFIVQWTLWEQ